MRKCFILMLLAAWWFPAVAQVNKAEYFIDTDPGIGQATAVTVASSTNVTLKFNVPLTAVAAGVHTLYVRVRDAKGHWSLSSSNTFFSTDLSKIQPQISKAEYFIDTDPGFGSGTAIQITAGVNQTAKFNIPLANVAAGLHTLYIRVRDSKGHWSLSSSNTFFVTDLSRQMAQLSKAEYFIDTDPGIGSGTAIPITAATDVTAKFNVPLANLPGGLHTLYVRVRDSKGHWSLSSSSTFYNTFMSATAAKLVKAEYFVDTDPGYGLGTTVSLPAGQTTTAANFNINLSALTNGAHVLNVRVLDSHQVWSLTNQQVFFVEPIGTGKIVALKYFYTATGFTSPTYTYTVPAPSVSVDLNFKANLSALTVDKAYTMNISAITDDGKVSQVLTKPFKICSQQQASAGFTFTQNNLSVTFTADSSKKTNYKFSWDFGDGKKDTLGTLTHTYAAMGSYTVKLIANNFCYADTVTKTIQVPAVTTQTINFPALTPVVYGAADIVPKATASSGLAVTYTSNNLAVATITADGKIHIAGAGSAVITASQAGNGSYNATSITQPLNVNQAQLTVRAFDQSKVYGTALPKLTAFYGGFISADDSLKLTSQASIVTTATAASPAGNYPITASGISSANYKVSYLQGVLSVTPAPAVVKAINQTKVYGAPNPPLQLTYSGLVNGDDSTKLAKQAGITTAASTGSGAGNYSITASGASSVNYNFTYTAGTLTITPATLNVKADDKAKAFGAANPQLTLSYTGFVNGNSPASLTAQPVAATTATIQSAPGSYPITVDGGTSTNYVFNYTAGTLVVTPPAAAVINNVNPLTAVNGSTVTITGTNFTGVTAVSFGGVQAQSFTVNSATSITAVVGNAASGNVAITTAAGTATFAGFTFIPLPLIANSGPLNILSGQNVPLSVSPASGYNYQWLRDGANIYGANSATYQATQSGTYTVAISQNGVTQTSGPLMVNVTFALPADNFKFTNTSATCNGSANGSIAITANQHLDYTATVNGTAYAFTDNTTISNLPAGTYDVCITVKDQPGYQQCFTSVISQPKDLSVYANVIKATDNTATNQAVISLSGADTYYVKLNGVTYTTKYDQITVPLGNGVNQIEVSTDLPCQGTISKTLTVADRIVPFPNPFASEINVSLGKDNVKAGRIMIYDLNYRVVYSKSFSNQSGVMQLNVSNLEMGAYFLSVNTDGNVVVTKMIKK